MNKAYRNSIIEEQKFYQLHYGSWLLGWLYHHERFYLGRYLFHYRLVDYYSQSKQFLSSIMYRYHAMRMNYYSMKTGLQFGIGSVGFGVRLWHSGWIIVHGNARIGKNLSIYPGVTIGQTDGNPERTPTIGDNVYIYQNAMVCGNIKVGNNVVILANSVVTHDVPDNVIVGGVPAKIIRSL